MSACTPAGAVVASVSFITSSHFSTKLRYCSFKLHHCSYNAVASVKRGDRDREEYLHMSEATARRNRPYAPRLVPEQRREQLLDVVLEIIDTDGVGAVSIEAVARRGGRT